MTPLLTHVTTRRTPRLAVWIVGLFFGGLLWLSLSELNPDWLAYRLIFESDGAWLGESGRDPVFLGLNTLMIAVLGDGGYETFRLLVAVYFFAFSLAFVTGRLSAPAISRAGPLSLSLAFIYLGFARFTIQIREGLAITVVMFAIALFQKAERRTHALGIEQGFQCLPWLLMLLATGIHASIGFVFLVMLTGRWVAGFGLDVAIPVQAQRRKVLWLIATIVAIAITVQLKFGGALDDIASETLGDRLIEQKDVTAAQFLFWGIYGVVCWVVYREARAGITSASRQTPIEAFLLVLAGPATFAIYASIIAALSFGITGLVISSYARLLYMFLALSIVYLASGGRRNWRVTLCCAFLLIDQMRNIADSISIYFGVDLY